MSFKFSIDTIELLRNFASINTNIYFTQGNVIQTITDSKNFMGRGEISEELPMSFGIYDLGEFLNVLNLVSNPVLKFKNDYVRIEDESGSSSINYYYSAKDILTVAEKMPNMPEVDLEFDMNQSVLLNLKKAGATLGAEHLVITKSSELLNLSVSDKDNPTSNVYTTQVPCETELEDFKFIFNLSNIRVLDGDYKVKISSKLISEFENTKINLKYWLAADRDSKV